MGVEELNRINDAIYKAATGNLESTGDKLEEKIDDEDTKSQNPSEHKAY
jgi:hypothetical protein